MNVVSDASPLIILAKIGWFDLLPRLHSNVYISEEVYDEVVVAGVGLPGASEVANAAWIKVRALHRRGTLKAARTRFGLGLGELSTILLAKELDIARPDRRREWTIVGTAGRFGSKGDRWNSGESLRASRNLRSSGRFPKAGSPQRAPES